MAGQGVLRELLGPLHPYKSDDEEDCAQEEEGEQDSEFVDAEELCSGGIKAGSLPGRMRGERAPARPGWQGSKKYFRFSLPGRLASSAVDRPVVWLAASPNLRCGSNCGNGTYCVKLGFDIYHLIYS